MVSGDNEFGLPRTRSINKRFDLFYDISKAIFLVCESLINDR
jgi:hypothetical protein